MTPVHDFAALAAYLRSNRDFAAPAVGSAVRALRIADGARVLDAGTGAGGGLVALAGAAEDVRVVGVDVNPAVVDLAAEHARQAGLGDRVTLRAVDLTAFLDEETEAFDAIWASDVVWPGNFADPAAAVGALAGALSPGGVLALFSSNYYQAQFLPGHSRLQQKLRTASELNWGLPGGGPTHYERHVHWAVAAGLRNVRVRVLPRVAFPVDDDPTARPYLERVVWPELLEAARKKGREAGMDDGELELAEALLTPGSDRYLLDEPGYYLVHSMLLVTGAR